MSDLEKRIRWRKSGRSLEKANEPDVVQYANLSEKFYVLAYEKTEEEIVTQVTNDVGNTNPGRYPKHSDPYKGQVYGGECNRTACERHDAIFWNMGTYGLYCVECARGINYSPKETICIRVDSKPALDYQQKIKKDNNYCFGYSK